MNAVPEFIKNAIALSNDSFEAGRQEGYKQGFRDGQTVGLEVAKRLINGESPETILAERATGAAP